MIEHAAGGAASGVGRVAGAALSAIVFGSFNPGYKKENQRRMRYIQSKYAKAYAGGAVDDYDTIIKRIDPNSKIRMTDDRPANPFPNERAFEESLEISYTPISGHQGRFAASHALKCQAEICQYQLQRRRRLWVPGLSSPGKPNDYVNMFLEEMKTWLRTQMNLDTVAAEELKRREEYISKIKHDQYYWCFPEENSFAPYTIHTVIDFVHNSVLDALEITTREEKNKSLQQMFKELNSHTNNSFEFGKSFMAYILACSIKAGVDLVSSEKFDGQTFEKGSLHHALLGVTNSVMKSYVTDMKETDERIESGNIGYKGDTSAIMDVQTNVITSGSPSTALIRSGDDKSIGTGNNFMITSNGSPVRAESKMTSTTMTPKTITSNSSPSGGSDSRRYYITVPMHETFMSGTIYNIDVRDPDNHRWIVRKSYKDFKKLHRLIAEDYVHINSPLMLPPKMQNLIAYQADYEARAEHLRQYMTEALRCINEVSPYIRKVLAKFLETRELASPAPTRVFIHAETVPNIFVNMKKELKNHLMTVGEANKGRKASGKEKDLFLFRQNWGIEWMLRILDGYAMLQRMSTLLAWTLEINHFFVSMFGNTLTFSKLPLRDILMTLKDILSSFLAFATDLFKYACQLNADQQYKWHKNLQACENYLGMLKHHSDLAVAVINQIDTDHLDYETQMKRLLDVASRFQPLMSRVNNSLPQIQEELGLPVHNSTLSGPENADALARPVAAMTGLFHESKGEAGASAPVSANPKQLVIMDRDVKVVDDKDVAGGSAVVNGRCHIDDISDDDDDDEEDADVVEMDRTADSKQSPNQVRGSKSAAVVYNENKEVADGSATCVLS